MFQINNMKKLLLLLLFSGCTYNISQVQQGNVNSSQATGIANTPAAVLVPALLEPEPVPLQPFIQGNEGN
jgi:hypothetical protein